MICPTCGYLPDTPNHLYACPEGRRIAAVTDRVTLCDGLVLLADAERRIPHANHAFVVGCRCYTCGWNAALDRMIEVIRSVAD